MPLIFAEQEPIVLSSFRDTSYSGRESKGRGKPHDQTAQAAWHDAQRGPDLAPIRS
jgi:hypothetical protein